MARKGRKYKQTLTFRSQVRSLALKFYVEQLMTPDQRKFYDELLAYGDWVAKDAKGNIIKESPEVTLNRQQAKNDAKKLEANFCRNFWDKIHNLPTDEYYVAAIYHNRDWKKSKDDLYEISAKKGHWHLIIWPKDPKKRPRISTLLNMFGITFDGKLDYDLWDHRGAEIIGDKPSYFMYLLHRTERAEKEGKTPYTLSEVATNLSADQCQNLMDGYTKARPKKQLKPDDWDKLANDAYDLGKNLGDWDTWVNTVLNTQQQAMAPTRVVRAKYVQGLKWGVAHHESICRVSILIYGAGNLGKSYTSRATLKKMGLDVCLAPKGSGKYDNLTPHTDALLFDDVSASDARNVFDNSAVMLHRRNQDDRPWLGHYAVATTNDMPSLWLKKMAGVNTKVSNDYEEQQSYNNAINAISQRLYICHIDPKKHQLVCDKRQERGSIEDRLEHDQAFMRFFNLFNEILKGYHMPDPKDENRMMYNYEEAVKDVKDLGAYNVDEFTLAISRLNNDELREGLGCHEPDFNKYVIKDCMHQQMSFYKIPPKYENATGDRYILPLNIFLDNLDHYGRKLTDNYVIFDNDKLNDFFTQYAPAMKLVKENLYQLSVFCLKIWSLCNQI